MFTSDGALGSLKASTMATTWPTPDVADGRA